MNTLNSKKKVVVGMSGGVDSSVSAFLLKEQGYDVIGLFMKNWDEGEDCPAEKDFEDVARVCDTLKIPFYSVNFTKEYWNLVFAKALEDFKKGATPNPDILCNREIKFSLFFDKALSLGADFLATGHYCQVLEKDGERLLGRGKDPDKDQSYFLYTISSNVLEKVLFPVGHLHKTEVRKIAEDANLATFAKKDSTGICFVGKQHNFRDFLKRYIDPKPGFFETLSGKKVGSHEGHMYYTIGQRKGLKIGGSGDAWYVVAKDPEKNIVFVEQGDDHPSLSKRELFAEDISWVSRKKPLFPLRCTAKIRYRQADQTCTVFWENENLLKVSFDEPQKAVTTRQSIVFYQGDFCLGGGFIL